MDGFVRYCKRSKRKMQERHYTIYQCISIDILLKIKHDDNPKYNTEDDKNWYTQNHLLPTPLYFELVEESVLNLHS